MDCMTDQREANALPITYCVTHGQDHAACRAEQAHEQAQAALEQADAHELLTKAYALTHRMHMGRTDDAYRAATPGSPLRVAVDELRAARDMITAELVRRCEA